MATGGEDGRVNLWQVGSPNCILVCLCAMLDKVLLHIDLMWGHYIFL